MRRTSSVLGACFLIALVAFPASRLPAEENAEGRVFGWSRYPGNPVLSPGPLGSWDERDLFSGSVVQDGPGLKLYYSASNQSPDGYCLGLAGSVDGMNWTKYAGNPVLAAGSPGSWDSRGISGASVLVDNGTFKMWYSAMEAGPIWRIGYATSPDGISWTRHPSNPVLDVGPSGSWDDGRLLEPCVLKVKDTFMMYYGGDDGFHINIGLAVSADGVKWTRSAKNPVLPIGAGWEADSVDGPCVLFDGDMYRMWYGGRAGKGWAVGQASSRDGLDWVRHAGNPVLAPGSGWESAAVHFPAVWFNGSTYRMVYTGDGATGSRAFGLATGNTMPNPPVDLNPFSLVYTNHTRPELSWNFSDPDDGDMQTAFEVQISNNLSFAALACSSGKQFSGNGSHRPSKGLPDDAYHWRVRTWDDTDQCGPWSEPASFCVDTVPPENPADIFSTSHKVGVWSSNNRINITVRGVQTVDGNTELGYTSIGPGAPIDIEAEVVDAGETETTVLSPALADGKDYWFLLRSRDRAGNWANETAYLGPFYIDTTPPEIMRVAMTNGTDVVNNHNVTLSISASDPEPSSGIAGIANSFDNLTWESWETYSCQTRVMLPEGDGKKTIFARVTDRAGNIGSPANVTVFLDTEPVTQVEVNIECAPDYDCTSGNRAPVVPSSGNGTIATNNRTVRVGLHATDPEPGTGLYEMAFCIDGLDWSGWEPFSQVKNLTLPEGDGVKTVKVRLRDQAGNIAEAQGRTVLLDKKAPGAVSVVINGGAVATNNSTVRLRISAIDPEPSSGLWDMTFSEDGANWTAWEPFNETRLYTFGKGDGNRTLHVRVGDRAMNAAAPVTASILVDTIPPAITSVKVLKRGTTAATVEVVLSEPCSISLDYGTSTKYPLHVVSPDFKTTHVMELPNLSPGKIYHFRVSATDQAGNPSAPSEDQTFTTKAAPATPAGSLPALAAFVVAAFLLMLRRGRCREQ